MRATLLLAGFTGMAAAQTITSNLVITINGTPTTTQIVNTFYGAGNATNTTATPSSRIMSITRNATLTFTTPSPPRITTSSSTMASAPITTYTGAAVANAGSLGFAGLVAAAALVFA